MDECPKCKHRLRHRGMQDDNICDKCHSIFDNSLKEVMVDGVDLTKVMKDSRGNYYSTLEEVKDNQVRYTQIFYLEKGRTTLRGDYPKLKSDDKCRYPERLSCNGEIGCNRCEFMTYGGSLGNWVCKYKK